MVSSVLAAVEYPLARYCPDNYQEGRKAFLDAARKHPCFTEEVKLEIAAKGPEKTDLSVDIAILGDLSTAKKILVHISGTHGVEGYAGSAIQSNFLDETKSLPENSAMILVHTVNPWGMAWNRRVNENNVDMNRNFTDLRTSAEGYDRLNAFMNPETNAPFCPEKYKELIQSFGGFPNFLRALANGQYDFPKGLFYGGEKYEESGEKLLNWIETKFHSLNRDPESLYFVIVDIHTGLGAYADDTLLTITLPTKKMIEIFGEAIEKNKQSTTADYLPKGLILPAIEAHVQKVTNCAKEHIIFITQEFGTIAPDKLLCDLREENILWHQDEREGIPHHPIGIGGTLMLNAFTPQQAEWKHKIVEKGRTFINHSFKLLDAME